MSAKATTKKSNLLAAATVETNQVYEVPVVMTPILPEDVKGRVIPAIQKLAKRLGGEVSVKDDWGKRHLAYEIDGNEEGYYVFLNLEISPSKVKEFEIELTRMPSDILRFLIIREDNL